MMHRQCNARPTAIEHHRPLTGTKLYCFVTEAHVCEQLAQGYYVKVKRPRGQYSVIIHTPCNITLTDHNRLCSDLITTDCALTSSPGLIRPCMEQNSEPYAPTVHRISSFMSMLRPNNGEYVSDNAFTR